MSFSQILLFLIALIMSIKTQAQSGYKAGVYEDIHGSGRVIELYSSDGTHYFMKQKGFYSDFEDSLVAHTTLTGLVREGEELMYLSGPFVAYGREGYFYDQFNTSYYFDELNFAYRGYGARDSLLYVYKRKGDLPADWGIAPNDRVGECGLYNNQIVYLIAEVVSIDGVQDPNYKGKLLLKIRSLVDSEYYTECVVVDEERLEQFEPFKGKTITTSDIIGNIYQFVFVLDDGFYPGLLDLSDKYLDANEVKRCTPFEMLLVESLDHEGNATITLNTRPLNWFHSDLSKQFDASVFFKHDNYTSNIQVNVEILSKSGGSVQTIQEELVTFGAYSVYDTLDTRSYTTKVRIAKQIVDNWFGSFVVADFNFDGLDDFAVTREETNTGPLYHFFIQQEDGTFELNETLTNQLGYFPSKMKRSNKTLTTHAFSGLSGDTSTSYKYNKRTKDWELIKSKSRN